MKSGKVSLQYHSVTKSEKGTNDYFQVIKRNSGNFGVSAFR